MIRVPEYACADARFKRDERFKKLISIANATGKKPRLSIRAATAANSKHGRK